eukprot:Stramenopile-MAST_4_protein_2403
MVDGTGEAKVCVVDIGRINPFAFEKATVYPDGFKNRKWECVGAEAYHTRISGRGAKMPYEEDRRQNKRAYREALESLATATKKTCLLDAFVQYCRQLAAQFTTVWQEKKRYVRRTIKIRTREREQRELDNLVNYICGTDVNVVFVGTGNVNAAKGHATVPTKKFIRRCGNVCCTVPINEFGTSSRCPVCQDKKTKVTRVKRERKDSVTPSQRDNREGIVSTSTDDGRMEQCSTCKNEWEHDKISTLNMLHIAKHMLCGMARPEWLK